MSILVHFRFFLGGITRVISLGEDARVDRVILDFCFLSIRNLSFYSFRFVSFHSCKCSWNNEIRV